MPTYVGLFRGARRLWTARRSTRACPGRGRSGRACPRRRSRVLPGSAEALDDRDVGLAAALAHRLQAVAAAGALELVEQRRHEPGAGRADRVAERDATAVDVDLLQRARRAPATRRARRRRTPRCTRTGRCRRRSSPVLSSACRVARIGPVSIQTGSSPAHREVVDRGRAA